MKFGYPKLLLLFLLSLVVSCYSETVVIEVPGFAKSVMGEYGK